MRRFYKDTSTVETPAGFTVALDAHTLKTPGKSPLIMPTVGLACEVAAEWQAQGDTIDTKSMPITQLANTTIDRVIPRFELVASEVAGFAATDLLCYRAGDPPDLAAEQKNTWDPYLRWAAERFSAPLNTTVGIMPIVQNSASLDALAAEVNACTPFELTALHEFTNAFGSLVLALAYFDGFAVFEALWQASILDQMYQEDKWGEDYEAIEKRAVLLKDLAAAQLFLKCLPSKITGKQA